MCGAAGAAATPRDPAPGTAPPPAGPPSPLAVGLRGLCPRCSARTLFAGTIRFAGRCRACGLDFARLDVGDGPAAFLTLIVGAIVCAGAIALELGAHPPVWVHVLVWPPLTILLVVALLRVAKGVLAASALRTRPPA